MFPVRVNKSLPEVARGRERVAPPAVGACQHGVGVGGVGEAGCVSGRENNAKNYLGLGRQRVRRDGGGGRGRGMEVT